MATIRRNSFHKQIQFALKYLDEPLELAMQSPLANAFFLGNHLSKINLDTVNQTELYGYALQKLLQEGLEVLAQRRGEEYRALIQAKYVEKLQGKEASKKLSVGKTNFHKMDNHAIEFLSEFLLERSRPSQRLETLPQIRRNRKQKRLIGRAREVAACQQILDTYETIALVGPGGVGKSTLGSYLATEWGEDLTFWYTIRPGLNDQLGSLLFALGHFFHQHQISHLWAELAIHQGEIRLDELQWVIRRVIEEFNEKYKRPPLFCFDEMDLLKVSEISEHEQIQNFIEALRPLAPQIVMGQQIWLDIAHRHRLVGFELKEAERMLTDAGLSLNEKEVEQICEHTAGNPQLLELIITLHQLNESIEETLQELSRNFTVLSLLKRVVQRLKENQSEYELLQQMIVYRSPTPTRQWTDQVRTANALNSLIERHLVREEGRGNVALIPTYRQALYQATSIEMREKLHQSAAFVRQSYGEYTSAAYHHIHGGQISQAIWLWHNNIELEINQGQASAALELFKNVSSTNLEKCDQDGLHLIRSRLELLMGDTAQAQETLRSILNTPTQMWKLEALEQQGLIDEIYGNYDNATNNYEQALELAEALLDKRPTYLHRHLGWIALQERDIDKAWDEAQLARYAAENFQGTVQKNRGNIEEAQHHYITALHIAEKLDHTEKIASVYNQLYTIHLLRCEFEKAEQFLCRAEHSYEKIDDARNIAIVKYNRALLYNQSGEHEKSVTLVLESLALFQRLGDAKGISYANQTLAEASVLLGNLEDAEHYAYLVQEEEAIQMFPDFHWILGQIRTAQGEFEMADAYFDRAIKLAQSNEDPYIEAYAWRSWGEMHLKWPESDVQQAEDALEKSIDIFEKMNLPYEVEKTREIGIKTSAPTGI